MTENIPPKTLEDIARALSELAEAIRGGENEQEPDPLDEVLPGRHKAADAFGSDGSHAEDILAETGAPRTIRNLLKALMRVPRSDEYYTVFSPSTEMRYRIYRVRGISALNHDGSPVPLSRTNDFCLPVSPKDLAPGWDIPGVARVLEVFWKSRKCYIIAEKY